MVMDATIDRKILEELIYERVRLAVDLCELVTFEEDLSASIERALEQCAESPRERADMTLRFLERAWERLGKEVMDELAESSFAPRSARACRLATDRQRGADVGRDRPTG